ncbi:hypothetical protein CYLTODRAFT_12137 [Cylindrobasidium torrendii FP15055 ss-10]|uniref:F-box domain-containing protein n=1 Tax=Cylindrobasidium torrendii FP15055 ss-10 TaxID=1314674 RepID=A0A0D7B9I8_9AGAR|nr:hypothetical protein CYLTODRAFT_12137 [Cylindrobasidium torrendii FP15055 ss-10]
MDLLQLSRTSKHLRSHLMNASARYAWRTAFEFVFLDGIREVREDLEEPRLANLFEQHCDRCAQKPGLPHLLLRARLCAPCFKSSSDFLSKPDLLKAVLKSVPTYDPARHVRLLQVTPYSGIASYLLYPEGQAALVTYSQYTREVEDYNYFDVNSHLEMVDETEKMKDKEFERWYKQEAKNFSGLWDECKQLYDFLDFLKVEVKQEKEKEKAKLREERKLDICARLTKAGYYPAGGTWDGVSWCHQKCERIFRRAERVTDEAWIKEDMLNILVNAGGLINQEERCQREVLWRQIRKEKWPAPNGLNA